MPTREAPGIGASMRRLGAASASARSLSRATMLSTLTRVLSELSASWPSLPLLCRDRRTQPGTSPNMVTTGPIFTSSTFTSMPYSLRVLSMRPDVFSWSTPGSWVSAGASASSDTGGSTQSSRFTLRRTGCTSGSQVAPLDWGATPRLSRRPLRLDAGYVEIIVVIFKGMASASGSPGLRRLVKVGGGASCTVMTGLPRLALCPLDDAAACSASFACFFSALFWAICGHWLRPAFCTALTIEGRRGLRPDTRLAEGPPGEDA